MANNSTTAKSARRSRPSARVGVQPDLRRPHRCRVRPRTRGDPRPCPLSVSVWKARGAPPGSRVGAMTWMPSPQPGAVVGGRAEIAAARTLLPRSPSAVRPVGTSSWRVLGTDDNAPYRDSVTSPAGAGTSLVQAITKDVAAACQLLLVLRRRGRPGACRCWRRGGVGPVPPSLTGVSVPGSHNSEMGCPGDWQPDCIRRSWRSTPLTRSGRQVQHHPGQ